MTKPMILGLVGGLLIVAAITLTFLIEPNLSVPIPGLASDPETTENSPAKQKSADAPAVETKAPPETQTAKVSPDDAKSPAGRQTEESGKAAQPSFDIVRVNPAGDTVIAGRAAPNAEIIIREGDKIVGTATADRRGEWVIIPGEPLSPGARELSLAARDKTGKETAAGRTVIVVVPAPGKDVAGAEAQKNRGALALSVPKAGTGTRVIQKPGDGSASRDAEGAKSSSVDAPVTIDAVDYDGSGRVTINGTAAPEASLHVYLDNRLAARGNADKAGRWRVVPGKALPPGTYTLRIDHVNPQGKVIRRAEANFLRPASPTALEPKAVIKVESGNSLWRIARRVYGEGVLYSVIYEANRNQIRDPDLIYPGQVFFVPHRDGNG